MGRWLAVVHVQDSRPVPSVSVQPDRIDLGETATLTLAVEGPAPLRVELPNELEKLLTSKSALMWQIKPLGPPRTTSHDGGRERWEQTFRLSPFFHGDRVSIAFNSITANGQPLTFDVQTIRVRKTIEDAKADTAVPVTGIEQLPPIPATPVDASGWLVLAALGGVFGIVLIAVLVRRSRAAPPPTPPVEWAERELDRLERDHALERADARAATERLAAILREFVERRFGLTATRLTTAELQSACEAAEWPGDRTSSLQSILEACDRAKFASQLPDAGGLLHLIGAARTWAAAARPDPAASLHSST